MHILTLFIVASSCCSCSFQKCADVCFVTGKILLFVPNYLVLLLHIFIFDVLKSIGALFIYFYCCVADMLKTEWPLCV